MARETMFESMNLKDGNSDKRQSEHPTTTAALPTLDRSRLLATDIFNNDVPLPSARVVAYMYSTHIYELVRTMKIRRRLTSYCTVYRKEVRIGNGLGTMFGSINLTDGIWTLGATWASED